MLKLVYLMTTESLLVLRFHYFKTKVEKWYHNMLNSSNNQIDQMCKSNISTFVMLFPTGKFQRALPWETRLLSKPLGKSISITTAFKMPSVWFVRCAASSRLHE